MGNEHGLQHAPEKSTTPEDYYQNERGCECGFIPFETENEVRSNMIAIKGGPIPSFEMNKNGQCECGFTPFIDKANGGHAFHLHWIIDSFKTNSNLSRKCRIQMALRNHNTFPAVDTLMRWKRVCSGKSRHWCTLIEIAKFTQDEDFVVVEGFDILCNGTKVYFDDILGKSPQTFSWTQMKNGCTLAIL